eukprot:COSAG01_NODE_585_length_15160_cov_15.779473_5_plen_110_part_00
MSHLFLPRNIEYIWTRLGRWVGSGRAAGAGGAGGGVSGPGGRRGGRGRGRGRGRGDRVRRPSPGRPCGHHHLQRQQRLQLQGLRPRLPTGEVLTDIYLCHACSCQEILR